MTPVAPADLALYVHWPYCARICPYCDFNVARARGREAEAAMLGQAIIEDLRRQAAQLGPRRLVSIFFGGGTPSLMTPAQVAGVVDAALALFTPAEDLEITLEANPTDVEAARFEDLAAAGVNRLSLGLQALDDMALKFLGRNHTAEEGARAAATAAGIFRRVSIDLIYARPGQVARAWAAELSLALQLGSEHVSPYQLTLEPGTPFARAVARGRFAPADPELAATLFETTAEVLEAAGFEAYEISNHAHGESARARHNLAIWRGAEYLGVGPGAHGRLRLEGTLTATRAAMKAGDYLQRIALGDCGLDLLEPLSEREAAEERLLVGLRLAEGVSLDALAPVGLSADSPVLTGLVEAGLLRLTRGRLAATPAGRLVLDPVLGELLIGPP